MKKIALITGGMGQDGSYLAELLLNKKYKVVVGCRELSKIKKWRHKILNIHNKIIYEKLDVSNVKNIKKIFKKYKFNEVYNLAALSFAAGSFKVPVETSKVTGLGCMYILEILKDLNHKSKFFQASSSEIFGNNKSKVCNENTYLDPVNPYGLAKQFAHVATKNYRKKYNIFASNGILFNHESPLRGEQFVTKKIVKALTEIKFNKKKDTLKLGNIYSRRDWGHAKDYVNMMYKILIHKKADDFVISSEKQFSIKEFIILVCKKLNMPIKWQGKGFKEKALYNNKIIIEILKEFFRPNDVIYLLGDSSKAKKVLKWKPNKNINLLIDDMVNFEINNLKK